MSKKTYFVGIDLGTTFSAAFVFDEVRQEAKVLTFLNGDNSMASVVNYKRRAVGAQSLDVICEVKRLIGCQYSDPAVLEETLPYLPYEVEKDEKSGLCRIKIDYDDGRPTIYRSPEQVSAVILYKIKVEIQRSFGFKEGTDEMRVVVTCPAYFKDLQKELTSEAARQAGLDVIKVLQEPSAAAYCYGLEKLEDGLFFTFDFGGGTLDTTVMKKAGTNITFVWNGGDQHLGGLDVDKELVKLIENRIKEINPGLLNRLFKKSGNEGSSRRMIKQRREFNLKKILENVKVSLSQLPMVDVDLSDISEEAGTLGLVLSREDLETACEKLFERCMGVVKKTLKESNISAKSIKKVILVGGSSQIPKIREMLGEYFGAEKLLDSIDCNLVVAKGACRYAFDFGKGALQITINEVMTRDLYLEGVDERGKVYKAKIVEKGTALPLKESSFPAQAINSEIDIVLFEEETELGRFTAKTNIHSGDYVMIKVGVDTNGVVKLNVLDKDGKIDPNSVVANVERKKVGDIKQTGKASQEVVEFFS
ncbi:heat shock cognate HSP70 protein, putative [Entamoeba invadens IP1]|uniref:heat shock cognate HSP70 protein, putative n=1 Tax=Entamoeba invadens IP1 TaxID=370355 RepID=UPI0002C3E0B4|nr:heat shock cognate HSP70 protein, putative [Entamoeba invadens IP1]ELP93044.1 heat shock cognate HSP70 protein, putative [Entamoeba invadens IP1]|eukprot:XP_004259815.1 heat shock cognate HSP70 protein, putative [Entamoeba invadens IP1]